MHCAWKLIIVLAIIVGAGFLIYWFLLYSKSEHHDQGRCQVIDPSRISHTITVSQSGVGDFYAISDAIDSIPFGNRKWIRIFVYPGIYEEKIKILKDKEYMVLEGSGRSRTTVTFDAHESTAESSTFAVHADNFVAKDITFKNSHSRKDDQAVAFRTSGDKHAYFSCGFEGYQDTLWDDKGRHYFESCYIEGAVDFIWGDGQSIYEKCDINIVGGGYITAQGRNTEDDPSGFVFKECEISGTGHGFLGRAYRPYSRVIFIDSKFSDVIDPLGWFIWHQDGHEDDITYAEVDCTGPGSDTAGRVPWMKKLDNSQVEKYSREAFIDQDGWIAKLPC